MKAHVLYESRCGAPEATQGKPSTGAGRLGRLRQQLAGTETAREWPGYNEGAIDSGERAAGEVLTGL